MRKFGLFTSVRAFDAFLRLPFDELLRNISHVCPILRDSQLDGVCWRSLSALASSPTLNSAMEGGDDACGAPLRSGEGRGKQAAPKVLVDTHSLTHSIIHEGYHVVQNMSPAWPQGETCAVNAFLRIGPVPSTSLVTGPR